MADKRISQLVERTDIANNDVLPIVASGATTTNKVTISTIQDWMQENLDVGVTSVGLSMPSAFTVSNSPVTTSGNISVTGAGTVSQYIRGDGSLADFPTSGGGGSSVSYYLNGSVSQGTIGGVAYLEMNKTPVLGTGTDFNINANGYIASFVTDAGDPALLQIPGGNWNFETYFSASSGGGTPSFYVELYKISSGGTATLIASNSTNPELIAFGTTINAYFSSLAVPTTTLLVTDRLALRYYVTHSGRTITLHTENSHLCQIITTFTTGLTALNGLTAQVQNFATGTSGTDFNISSASTTHTFNLPDASASNRGAVTTGSQVFGGVKTFANGLSLPSAGGSNQVTRIVNIGTLHEGSATLNQIGFNSANNIYFGKGLSNGGVLQWTNAAVRYYTLPDADGTIALTSQIPSNIVTDGGVGTADRVPKFTGAGVLTNSAIADQTNEVNILKRVSVSVSSHQIVLTPSLGGVSNRIETTNLPLELVTTGSAIRLAAGGATPQFTLSSAGLVTLTGALNGTSASFLSGSSSTIGLIVGGAGGAGATRQGQLRFGDAGSVYKIQGGEDYAAFNFMIGSGTPLSLASTGAATFSSSVTANGTANAAIGGLIVNYSTASGSSRSWRIANDLQAFGDFGIEQSTTQTGSTYATRLYINPTGNVGIGTASPSDFATLTLVKNGASNYSAVACGNSNSTANLFVGVGGSSVGNTALRNNAYVLNAANSDLILGTNDTERMRITSVGNTQPGSDNAYSLGVSGTRWSAVWAANGTIQTSDEREKKDIVDSDLGLDLITKLRPVSFKWKVGQNVVTSQVVKDEEGNPILDEEGNEKTESVLIPREGKRTHYGLIAQEVEEVLDGKDFGGFIHDEETDTKGLRYDQFVPLLIKSIQELNDKIAILESKLK